jgi:hypothetical protein
MEETLDIDGTGINLTLGIIYRPVDFLQIGASFVTPTYYQITDSYTAKVSTQWNNYDYLDTGEILNSISYESAQPVIAEYNLSTPLKVSTGAAVFLGKYGMISGDVEFINYGNAKYNSETPGVSFNPENDDIDYYFTNVVNYRVGAEFRYNIFRLRGGYNIQNNPYKSSFNIDQKISTVSAGVGVRFSKFFFDFAWLTSKSDGAFSQYVLANGKGPVATLSNKVTSGMLTVGLTF